MSPANSRVMWRIALHGPAGVQGGGKQLPLRGRAAALMALAALEPGIAREQAAYWLWPDAANPRQNLRQQLLRFKQALGAVLIEGEERLSLAANARVQPAADGAELLAELPDSDDDFGRWLARRRESARRARTEPLSAALAQAEQAGDLDGALRHARALRDLHADEEAHHASLMRVHYLRGESAAGLAAFEKLETMLRADYGTTPAPATQQLAAALRRGAAPSAPDLTRATLPLVLRRPPLMAGRSAALAQAHQAWDQGLALWLEGEAGLGKSRFIAELLEGDGRAWMVSGRPGDSASPYATLSRLLLPRLATTLSLSPEARQALEMLDPTRPAATAPLRHGALVAAVAELLSCCKVHTLAVDDMHFADAATLELLAPMSLTALAAPEEQARMRWLFAQRPAESQPAAQELRDAWVEVGRLHALRLQPLDASSAAALVDSLAIPDLHGPDLGPALVQHTGGNPLFMLETLKQGLVDGSLMRGRLPRPASVDALIERRLQRLSEPALALARVAAIAGVDFSIELAEAALGLRAVQLASSWDELQQAQVLRDEGFAHDLVADAMLRSVPQVVARRVHAQCAQWLAAHGGEPARVARHWLQGGNSGQAGSAFVAAALRANVAGRKQEEAVLYEQAAQAFEAAGRGEERFAALYQRGQALVAADFGDAALQAIHALIDVAQGDAQRLRAMIACVHLLSERSESADAVAMGRTAMAIAQSVGDNDAQVRLACHMASALCRLGRADEGSAVLLPLRSHVESPATHELRMLWWGDWAASLGLQGRLAEAVAAYEVALAAARSDGMPDSEGRLLMNCAVTLRQGGYFDRALTMSRQGRALSSGDSLDASHTWIAQLVVSRDESEAACYSSALAALEDVLPRFEAAALPFWAQAVRLVLVQLWLHLGQPARAMPLLKANAPDLPAWLQADRLLLQLELALALGQPAPAGALQAALTLAASDPQRGTGLRVRSLRHQALAERMVQAQELKATLARQERHGATAALLVHLVRADIEQKQVKDAAEHARHLLALMAQGVAPESMYRAEAWWVAHQALIAAGLDDQAQQALQQGTQWVMQLALPQVPPAFVDSFLHRNPVNRALMATAGASAKP